MQRQITGTETFTPSRIAEFGREDDKFWYEVPCDGGCGRLNTTNKVVYKPVDPFNDPSKAIEVTKTACPAWRCVVCGPFVKLS